MSWRKRFLLALLFGLAVLTERSSGQDEQTELLQISTTANQTDLLGRSVAMTGSWILAGAPWKGPGNLYVCDLASGQQLYKVKPSDGSSGDYFAWSVSASGTRAAVGAPFDGDFGLRSGSAYVIDLVTGSEIMKLSATDAGPFQYFGYSVSIDSQLAVVGAYGADGAQQYSGAAYVFDLATGAQLHKLAASDGEDGDKFGLSVAVDDGLVLVGAPYSDELGPYTGKVYVFDVTSGQELMVLTPSDSASLSVFGFSVALHGTHTVVGANNANGLEEYSGAAYVFDLTTGQELFKLVAHDGQMADYFGLSVAMDGDRIVVGAPLSDVLDLGAVYVFDALTGSELVKLVASDAQQQDGLGFSVALLDGLSCAGAPQNDDKGGETGSAYVHILPKPVGSNYCGPANLNSTGGSAAISAFGSDVAAHNLLSLTAHGIPNFQFGYFLASETKGFVPFAGNSQGNLCLAGNIARFNQQIQNSGAAGSFTIQVDLASIPTNPPQSVMAGETWNFQAWFRDMNPGPTSNFTDGVSVTFS